MASRKRVYIAYTGGTIGMRRTAQGYAPEPGYLAQQMRHLPELNHPAIPHYHIHEYTPLLDSANMTPAGWLAIAEDIARHYDEYDGFVVLHGTDTMAYTASSLPFLLDGLSKPVIVTGSQIPLCEVRNDARSNLINALLLAGGTPIPEVCLAFGDSVLRGCRAQKVDARGLQAFASPNYPRLGEIGREISIRWDLVRRAQEPSPPLVVMPPGVPVVAVLRVFPGISARLVENLLRPPLAGLVLEAYGTGNAPDHDRDLLDALRSATERGVVIVACSQCSRGRVDLTGYKTGAALAQAGVISGYDMTTEAAVAKLHYLFGQPDLPVERVRQLLQTDLRGELTPPA